ncbi:MAG: hypothetical protein BGN88_01540 [Clostridiales bacterium 43-6]|nr:MAG: hypothetical protein BGN88_01540 [Clostridiales bacterium 43-6]
MKKFALLTVIFIVLNTTACSTKPRFSDFNKYKSNLQSVVDYSMAYYTENKASDKDFLALWLSDSTWVGEEIESSAQSIKDAGFDLIWVADQYVIFWNDETKTFGLLYSKTAKNVISTIRNDWYPVMEYVKIEKDWYEIGQLNAI